MEQNESKTCLNEKPEHSFEVFNLDNNSLCQQNLISHTDSDPIFPFSIISRIENRSSVSVPNYESDARDYNEMRQRQSSEQAVVGNEERRVKRMISNRESARRSRMRRKMQIEELQCLVTQLQTTNRQLSDKLIQLLDCNQQIIQDNSHLKHKISSLQMLLSDFLLPITNNHNSSATASERPLRPQPSSTLNINN